MERPQVQGWRVGDKDRVGLSPAEHRVAECVCRGMTEKEIADEVYRSQHTVHTQMKNIYRKLGVRKDTELMWWMLCERLGLMFDIALFHRHGVSLITRIG